MLGCWEFRYVKNKCAWDTSLNNKKVSSTYRLYNIGLNNAGKLPNHNVSMKHIKIFAKVGPKGPFLTLLSPDTASSKKKLIKPLKVPYLIH